MKKPVVFLDFQGTLGGNGTDNITSFVFFPFSIKAIQLLNQNRILSIGITNQSDISRGKITMEDYTDKIQILKNQLFLNNAYLDEIYCCPHSSNDKCNCKKPLTGMIDTANEHFNLDMNKSYVIGDMGKSDIALAKKINAKGILVLTGVGRGSLNEYKYTWHDIEANYIAEDVLDAVQWIINDLSL
jgi:histidinol-phosphate phosphatase family protein